jgi:hypothetical protein
VEQVAKKTEILQQIYSELNQLNWKTHNDLKHLQNKHEHMTWDYNKIEQPNMQYDKI